MLVKQHLARGALAFRHERLQPCHRKIAVHRAFYLGHQLQHFPQAIDIQRQQDHVQHHHGVMVMDERERNEKYVGDDAEDAQRDHRPHRSPPPRTRTR
jgi:hypothetical protein